MLNASENNKAKPEPIPDQESKDAIEWTLSESRWVPKLGSTVIGIKERI
jgi:hypothetical protein